MVHAFTNTGTQKGKILFINTPVGPLERFLVEFGEPVSDPSSPPEGEPDMDKLQASAQRTGGIEFAYARRGGRSWPLRKACRGSVAFLSFGVGLP
jgi:hypothetical protein